MAEASSKWLHVADISSSGLWLQLVVVTSGSAAISCDGSEQQMVACG